VARRWPDVAQSSRERLLGEACPARVGRDLHRGDAGRQGRDGGQARHGVIRPAACWPASYGGNRAAVSVYFSEPLCDQRAAGSGLIAVGAFGPVVQTLAIGPHRLNRQHWPHITLSAKSRYSRLDFVSFCLEHLLQ